MFNPWTKQKPYENKTRSRRTRRKLGSANKITHKKVSKSSCVVLCALLPSCSPFLFWIPPRQRGWHLRLQGGILHCFSSRSVPSQVCVNSRPGSGASQRRVRIILPRPHVTEHGLKSPQHDHTPAIYIQHTWMQLGSSRARQKSTRRGTSVNWQIQKWLKLNFWQDILWA